MKSFIALAAVLISTQAFAGFQGTLRGNTTEIVSSNGATTSSRSCQTSLETYVLNKTETNQGQLFVQTKHMNCQFKGAAHLLTIQGESLIDNKTGAVVGSIGDDEVTFSIEQGPAAIYAIKFSLVAQEVLFQEKQVRGQSKAVIAGALK